MIRNPFRELDAKNMLHSSDLLKKQNDYQKIVNKRLNITTAIIVFVFICISARLIDIQVRQKDDYANKLENYTLKKQVISTPRGQMLDRNHKLVAQTVSSMSIVYYPTEDISADEQWKLAEKFAKQFDVSSEDLTFRDLQDAYITLHTDEQGINDHANHLIKDNERSLGDDQIYQWNALHRT